MYLSPKYFQLNRHYTRKLILKRLNLKALPLPIRLTLEGMRISQSINQSLTGSSTNEQHPLSPHEQHPLSPQEQHPSPPHNQSTYDSQESSGSDNKIPSDLTIDHHPQRISIFFPYTESEEPQYQEKQDEQQQDQQKYWVVNGSFNVTEKCYTLKSNTKKLASISSALSDIRICKALNDIYLFSDDINESVSKHFGTKHLSGIISDIDLKELTVKKPSKSASWCSSLVEVVNNSPV
ncbi:hypothetical protein MAM1_0186c07533 [Mucor ambiguus]|uniref:Uncharacterized protein n=1 Tax=Mucor ambiguus TaxID=91626 RepID=A0A0C9MWS9_9FUNG|nr:hypothetical protein MAM1_0186c07533 [Mucor ambiguus]